MADWPLQPVKPEAILWDKDNPEYYVLVWKEKRELVKSVVKEDR